MEKKEQWYYSEKGKAMGPVSKEQIMELLSRGALKTTDLIFKDGSDQWKKVHDCFALETETAKPPPQDAKPDKRPLIPPSSEVHSLVAIPKEQHTLASEWILLTKKVTGKETRFVQTGPHTTDEVKFKILKFEVNFDDHIWKEGFERWMKVSDIPDFDQRELKINSTNKKDLDNVLQLTVDEPTEVDIHEHTVAFSVVEQFNPKAESSPLKEEIQPQTKPHAALGLVMPPSFDTYKKPPAAPQHVESDDSEVSWEDKTLFGEKQAADFPVESDFVIYQEPELMENTQIGEPQSRIVENPLTNEAEYPVLKPKRSWAGVFATLLFVSGLGVAGYFAMKHPKLAVAVTTQFNSLTAMIPGMGSEVKTPVRPHTEQASTARESIPEPPPPPPVVAPPPPAVPQAKVEEVPVEDVPNEEVVEKEVPKPVEVVKEPPREVVKVKEPKNLELKMEDLSDLKNAKLRFSMDVPPGTPMNIRIQGKTGEILRHVAFDKRMNIKKGKGPLVLKLSEHSLGEGKYWVDAKIGAVSLRRSFFYGQNNNDFEKELAEHRKFISFEQQQERQNFIKTLKAFQKNTEEFVKSSRKGKVNLAVWNKTFKKLNSDQMHQLDSSLNYLAYAPLWDTLKGIQAKLLDATSAKEKRIPANEIGKEILNDLTKLKTDTTQYSIFKNYREE